jgi:hypothetical protein
MRRSSESSGPGRRSPRAGLVRVLISTVVVGGLLVSAALVDFTDLFTDPSPALGGRDSRCWRHKRTEKRFARKMNRARRRSRRGRLSLDPELSRVARKHTSEMIRRNLLYHTSQSQLGRRVTRWRYLGENIGVGGSVGSLHRAFMRSPPHRHNIMGGYRHVGVGVSNRRGRMWVTVIFERTSDPGTRLRMPRC